MRVGRDKEVERGKKGRTWQRGVIIADTSGT